MSPSRGAATLRGMSRIALLCFLLALPRAAPAQLGERFSEELKGWGGIQDLPPAPKAEGSPVAAGAPALTKAALDRALEAGARNLVAHQWNDGSWGTNPNIVAGLPNDLYARGAITAIVLSALERAKTRVDAAEAVRRGKRFMMERALPAKPLEQSLNNNQPYAMAYGLFWLLRQPRSEARDARVRDYVAQIDPRNSFYVPGRHTASSFQVALLVLALDESKRQGFEVSRDLEKGFLQLLKESKTNYGEAFGYYVSGDRDARRREAVSRLALCRLALHRNGQATQGELLEAADYYARNQEDIEKVVAKGRMVHTGEHGWAQYYYLFGMYWAMQALKEVPRDKARPVAEGFALALLSRQEDSGAWQDSAYFGGRSYGTATAMLILLDAAEIVGSR